MSLQVFLQAQLLGTEQFLASQSSGNIDANADFTGRCAWLSLIAEVLPRALLSDLKLSQMLLGSSSAEQFLLVLADETVPQANEFLERAAKAISELSGNTLRLVWASTENLGAWPIARKRLDDALEAKIAAPLSIGPPEVVFAPFSRTMDSESAYFAAFGDGFPGAKKVGWSPDGPATLLWDDGQYTWALEDQPGAADEGILFPRRFALDEAGTHPVALDQLAQRAEGAPHWGILLGDVDHFDVRLRRVGTIEEHIHLSMLFKQFLAGELSVLCTLPDFWRKVSILYRGGDDFAVIGTWDALVAMARELQRLFEKFAEHNLEAVAGLEGKTLTMALAIAPDADTPASAVFEEADLRLRGAKAADAGSFYLFGRTLEWKRLADAEELKGSLLRLVRDFGYAPEYIHDLASVYREAFSARGNRRGKSARVDKPWRTYLRLSRVIPPSRGKELTNLRNAVITNLAGKKTAGSKLRPSARVGLEWARLAAGS